MEAVVDVPVRTMEGAAQVVGDGTDGAWIVTTEYTSAAMRALPRVTVRHAVWTCAPTVTDAGVVTDGAVGDAGSAGDAGGAVRDDGVRSAESAGGCRVGRVGAVGHAGWMALAMAAALRRRRRQR